MATTPPTPSINGAGAAQRWLQGLGVGMVVDWARTERGIREFDPLVVRDFHQRGIGSVRIRVAGDATEQRLIHLRKIVEACEQYQVIPIISWQADEFKAEPNPANEAKAIAWWTTVARYFADSSPELGFELIASPSEKLNRNVPVLNRFYDKTVKAIHNISPQRIILIAPRLRAAPEELAGLRWPSQSNGYVVAAWQLFPLGPVRVGGKYPWTTGTLAEKAAIRARLYNVVRWQQRTGHLAWLSAWSAGDIPKNASLQSPVAFATFMSCELQHMNLPYAVNADTKFYDGEEGAWRPEMKPLLDAMLQPECPGPKLPFRAGVKGVKPPAHDAAHEKPAAASNIK